MESKSDRMRLLIKGKIGNILPSRESYLGQNAVNYTVTPESCSKNMIRSNVSQLESLS